MGLTQRIRLLSRPGGLTIDLLITALAWVGLTVTLPSCALSLNEAEAEAPEAKAAEKENPKPLGDFKNPIRCEDPGGERYYLARLVDPRAREIDFSRMGSFGKGPYGNILDGYEVIVGDHKLEVFMDMYHPGYYEERPIKGFYLRCRMSWDLVIHEDGLRYEISGDKPYTGTYQSKDEETDQLISEVSVKDGLLQGNAIRYHDNGNVHHEIPYTNSKQHGIAQYFDEEGNLAVSLIYESGLRHGESTWYMADGTVDATVTYVEGQLHGKWRQNHEDGSPREVGQFVEGKRDGEWVYYAADGKVERRVIYHNGKAVNKIEE